jgi:hypothetical protein
MLFARLPRRTGNYSVVDELPNRLPPEQHWCPILESGMWATRLFTVFPVIIRRNNGVPESDNRNVRQQGCWPFGKLMNASERLGTALRKLKGLLALTVQRNIMARQNIRLFYENRHRGIPETPESLRKARSRANACVEPVCEIFRQMRFPNQLLNIGEVVFPVGSGHSRSELEFDEMLQRDRAKTIDFD